MGQNTTQKQHSGSVVMKGKQHDKPHFPACPLHKTITRTYTKYILYVSYVKNEIYDLIW